MLVTPQLIRRHSWCWQSRPRLQNILMSPVPSEMHTCHGDQYSSSKSYAHACCCIFSSRGASTLRGPLLTSFRNQRKSVLVRSVTSRTQPPTTCSHQESAACLTGQEGPATKDAAQNQQDWHGAAAHQLVRGEQLPRDTELPQSTQPPSHGNVMLHAG